MNRWDHMMLTTIGFLLTWSIAQYFYNYFIPVGYSFWFLFVAWIGGFFPDFDSDWHPFLGHRSFVTHSIIAPFLVVAVSAIPLWFLGGWLPYDRYFIATFWLGCAGHLLLDLLPSSKSVLNRFLKNPLKAVEYIEHSRKVVPGNITRVPKQWERPWLIINAIILGLAALLVVLLL